MTAQVFDRSRLGTLTKVAQGGQGVVYQAPNGRTKFSASIVYKEYKAPTLAEIDFVALGAMSALVEDSLTLEDAELLISLAAWPCAIVKTSGTPTGFVMPAIPDQFVLPITTVKGVEHVPAEFQHLLNEPDFIAARGISLDTAQRCALLREVASALTFLHQHGICVGDLSPKNLLFSLNPDAAVYFVDCDTMRINGVSALPQVETPGWEVPDDEELATVYSDTYKLGLLGLRLLAGDQDTKDPQQLPPSTPNVLRRLITDTLNGSPPSRPLPQAWAYLLEEIARAEAPSGAAVPPREIPVRVAGTSSPSPRPTLRSRPSDQKRTGRTKQAAKATHKPHPPVPVKAQSTGGVNWSTLKGLDGKAKFVIGGIAVIAAVITSVVIANANRSSNAFAAAAYSSRGNTWGWARAATLDGATTSATNACEEAGAKAYAYDCHVVIWVENGCLAVIGDAVDFQAESGSTLEDARRNALAVRKSGWQMILTQCSSDGGE